MTLLAIPLFGYGIGLLAIVYLSCRLCASLDQARLVAVLINLFVWPAFYSGMAWLCLYVFQNDLVGWLAVGAWMIAIPGALIGPLVAAFLVQPIWYQRSKDGTEK